MEDGMPPLTGCNGKLKAFSLYKVSQIISVWSCVCKLTEDGMPSHTGDRHQGEGFFLSVYFYKQLENFTIIYI
jgi:hypothetical protein